MFIAAAAMLVIGCLGPPRPRARAWQQPLVSVRFDSPRELRVTPNLLALDTTSGTIEDVVEVGGRVTGYGPDTLLIEPYYFTMYDASREDRERTFYRGGAYRMPDLAIVEYDASVSVSEYVTPAARQARTLNNVLAFSLRILPLLVVLNVLRPAWHH